MNLMKNLAALLVLTVLFSPIATAQDLEALPDPGDTPTTFENPELVGRYIETITADDLAAHLYFFASDFFEGRETSTRGQKMAAEYLASQYRKMGLAPKGTAVTDNPRSPEAYLQPFPLYGNRFEQTELYLGDSSEPNHVFGGEQTDGSFMTLFGTGEADNLAEVVFAGYGIQDNELGYNDFAAMEAAGIDWAGKWVMILADEPMSDAETSLLPTEDNALSSWTTSRFDKLRVYFGGDGDPPAGILVVGDLSPRGSSVYDRALTRGANPIGVGGLSLDPPEEEGEGNGSSPIFLVISAELANEISGRDIAAVKQEIDSSLSPTVFSIDSPLRARVVSNPFETSSENVVAYIEGSDPVLKDEYVVISSHYDHIGLSYDEEDGVNNGADDDGSGTVAILEIAEAFIKAKNDGYGPRRSIIFLNVAGEEKGLLGSAYYTDHEPIVPLEQTVTNLNIDMIGRIDPTHPGEDSDYVYIIGSNLVSQELHDINIRANEIIGTKLDLNERFNSKDDPNQYYRRSDHWNFGKHNIPFIFFFTGAHEDYHGVGDEPDKIEYERMARIAHVIFATAWQVANQDTRPVVSGEGFN